MFHVGQKVVCIDDHILPGEPGPYVIRNAVYTIRSINEEPPWITLLFFELPPVWVPGWCTGYGIYAFRPLIERKTDISIFTEMLTPTKETV